MSTHVSKILKASVSIVAVSWYTRVLSLITVIVLARNLDKYDFGVLAGCFVIKGFFSVLSNVGSDAYLIRKNVITDEDADGAWTIGILSRTSVVIILIFTSDFIGSFMNIPELSTPLKVMSISLLFSGLVNPYLSKSIKELDYKKVNILSAISRTLSSLVSITIAVIYQTYWAVIIAEILYSIIYNIGSHFIVKVKRVPKFSLVNIGHQWQFTKWILAKGMIGYTKASFDKIIVSRGFSVTDLGLYNFSFESASTPNELLITPLRNILYPTLSQYIDDENVLVDKLYKFMLTLSCMSIPIVFGGVYLSSDIVPIVFGEQWHEAVPLFSAFLIMSYATMFNQSLHSFYTLIGKVKSQFFFECVTSAIFVMLILFASSYDLNTFGAWRSGIAYVNLLLLMGVLSYFMPLSLLNMSKIMLAPILSSIVMIFSIDFISHYLIDIDDLVRLTLSILWGGLTYFVCLLTIIVIAKAKIQEYEFVYQTFFKSMKNIIVKRISRI